MDEIVNIFAAIFAAHW